MKESKIGDCVEVINGFAFDSALFSDARRGLPLARIRDVVRGYSETFYDGQFPQSILIENGDLLVGMDGEFNVGRWNGGRALLNQRVCKVVAKDGLIDQTYLKHLLPRILQRIEDATPFVTVKHLSSEDLKEQIIALPPLAEQKRIATILERADRLRRYGLEMAKALLPAVFLAFFGDPAANPLGFPVAKVETLWSSDDDGVKCGPFGTALKKHECVAAGIPVWTMENIVQDEFLDTGLMFVTPAKFEELSSYSAKNDDILVSRAGTVGKMAVVHSAAARAIIHTNLIRLRFNTSKILPVYFTTMMNHFAEGVGKLKRGQEDA